jgi:hypothetical protein
VAAIGFGLLWFTGFHAMSSIRKRRATKASREDMFAGDEPGRTPSISLPLWLRDIVTVFLLATLIAGLMQWRDLNASEQKQDVSWQQRQEKERIKRVTAQMASRVPQGEVNFELQDSSWAFLALGNGAVNIQESRIELKHKGVRVMQRADCPSEACLPVRSIQWLLVVPRDAKQPDGGWVRVASSRPQMLRFQPAQRNDQYLQPDGQIELEIKQAFDPSQAYVMVQLMAEGAVSTYTRTPLLWSANSTQSSPQISASAINSNQAKSQKSLHAALYYADEKATREHLAMGTSVKERYENDASAAHIAAFSGCSGCLQALKEAGADMNDKVSTFRQETPLMMAIRNQQVEAARKLIELGADLCIADREGYDAKGWVNFYKLEAKFPFVSACAKASK